MISFAGRVVLAMLLAATFTAILFFGTRLLLGTAFTVWGS